MTNRDAIWEAGAVNERPWRPLPGMVKVRCEDCLYWFATPMRRPQLRCPDCELKLKALARKLAREAEAGPAAEPEA